MSIRAAMMLVVMTVACDAPTARAAGSSRAEFGVLPDGRRVEAVTLRGNGMSAVVINYGATLQSVVIPDRDGKSEDVALGYDSLEGYLKKSEYFGATVGRFANRIAKGKFTLDGKSYQTPLNNNGNSLHGGERGFDKVLWEIVAIGQGTDASVTMRYVSAHGEQGYPGRLTAQAKYSLGENELRIEYEATTDRPTIVNITNHAYWNLVGEGSPRGAMGHVLTIPADSFTPVDGGLIPTGDIRPVAGTVFDFREPTRVGDRVRSGEDNQIVIGRGYDHNFVIAREVAREPRLLARLEEPTSGRSFELWSTQPGLQIYSGNFLDATVVGKSRHIYRQGDAIVLEPQLFPDTPNRPEFGSARLEPGQTYRNVMIYRFFTNKLHQH